MLDIPEAHLCCGPAGTDDLLQPEIAGQLGRRKAANIATVAPDAAAAGNLGCTTQLGHAAGVPLLHTVELLDWATGQLGDRARRRAMPTARAMGIAEAGAPDAAADAALLTALAERNRALSVPTPAGYGLDLARWTGLLPVMAAQALASGSPANNPLAPGAAKIVSLYRAVWDG